MMRNPQTVRILWIVLAVEVVFGLICLLASRSAGSFFVILFIIGLVGGAGYFARYSGLWTADLGSGPSSANRNRRSALNERIRNTMNDSTNSWNFGNVSFNLGTYPERNEVFNQTVTLEEGVTVLAANVLSGSLKVTGQEGLNEIKISATRRVWERDEMAARAALDKLQLRTSRENNIFRIDAGDPNQGIVVGRAPRMEVELIVPAGIAANLSTNSGELSCRQFHGELIARTNVGSLSVEEFNSGHNINLTTTGGRITLQNVAAGQVRVKAGAGMIQLTGTGAEQFDLETNAGSIRARGVNCGRYNAHATTGNIELYEARIEYNLDLRTSAGRIQADNITTAAYHLEATTGAIFWRGNAPTAPSEVLNGVGNTQLYFLPSSGFNLEAQSSIGTVETYLPVSALAFQNRNSFNGQVAGGGAPIKVTSQVGTIRAAMG